MTNRRKAPRPRHYVGIRRLLAVTSVVVGVLIMHGLMPSGQAGAHYAVIDADGSHHAVEVATGHSAGSAIGHGPSFLDTASAQSAGPSLSSPGHAGHGALGSCLAVLGALALGWLVVLGQRNRASTPHPALSGFVPTGYRTTAVPRWPRLALCVIRV